MFQAMILMWYQFHLQSHRIRNVRGAQLYTKYSDFTLFENVFVKENFDSFKPSDTF